MKVHYNIKYCHILDYINGPVCNTARQYVSTELDAMQFVTMQYDLAY